MTYAAAGTADPCPYRWVSDLDTVPAHSAQRPEV